MKIGFIGAGNMGGAILRGYLNKSGCAPENIFVYDTNREKTAELEESLGIHGMESIEAVTEACQVIILGVKPNGFEEVLPLVFSRMEKEKIVVSMAAGIDIAFLEKYLGAQAKIVRIMPNTPAMVNEAMVAVCRNGNVTEKEFASVFAIFNAIGSAKEIDESLIHCVIGVSGSSPAYTYMYIEALADAAVANGMEKEDAVFFAAQSVLGAAKMVLETHIDPVQLRRNVCSPGGTTIEAVNKLLENGFEEKIKEGFQAAVDKSKAMVKQ